MYRISVPYAQKDPRFLFEKRRGQPREFWSLVSTIDVVHYPRTVWKNSYAEHEVTGKTYNYKKKETKKKGPSVSPVHRKKGQKGTKELTILTFR